jgi:hypothetical protein
VKVRLAALVTACAVAFAVPASAASAVVTVTANTLVFNATTLSNATLTASPVSTAATVTYTTTAGGPGGTVIVMAGAITSMPAGTTLNARDFTLTCKRTGANNGFVAAAPAALNGPTTCGTLAQGKTNVTSSFTIQLTLNDTTAAVTPFQAATYLGTLTVTATAS